MINTINSCLSDKYNIPIPRYTSFPPLPNWEFDETIKDNWPKHLKSQYDVYGHLSLYIHLPYCEKLCTYCGCNKRITTNHDVEMPYIIALLTEWAIYKKHLGSKKIAIKELHLGGGTPTFFSPQNLNFLLSEILLDQSYNGETFFSFEAHPNSTTLDHLKVLRKHGFDRISLGVQDVSPEIMKVINRDQTVEQIEYIIGKSRELGFKSINFDLVYGLPFQTSDHIIDTLQFVEKCMPDRIAYYSYAHTPWKSKGQRKYEDEDVPKREDKLLLKNIAYEYLEQLGYKRLGMDHFCLPTDRLYKLNKIGKMSRNFMGYTDNESTILLGLGCSSISSTSGYYVQNSKTIEEYSDQLEHGILPVVNGHKLSVLEKRLSFHINNIMCNLYTEFDYISEADEYILAHAEERLNELRKDHLITFEDDKLIINELGIDYLRNICVALDYSFISPEVKKYSNAD